MTECIETDELIAEIRARALSNIRYFESNKNLHAEQFIEHFNDILNNVISCIPILNNINAQMGRFDYDAEHKGNGYRSMFNYYKRMLEKMLKVIDKISKEKSSASFDTAKTELCKEIESWAKLSAQMGELLKLGNIYLENANKTNLAVSLNESTRCFVLETLGKIASTDAFLSYPLGFQLPDSFLPQINAFQLLLVGCSDAKKLKDEPVSLTEMLISSGQKYMSNPELRARKVHQVFRNADLASSKSLLDMNSSETQHAPTSDTSQEVASCKVITLKEKCVTVNKENLKNYINPTSAESLEVSLPQKSDGVKVKCVTNCTCESMLEKLRIEKIEPKPHVVTPEKCVDTIMLHIHGGGFFADDPQSEFYLRMWAKALNAPICSVEYSLAPDTIFPQQLEECYYTYAWMLETKPLGWSGKKVVFAGDSAGGNLVTSLVIRCIMTNLRVPDAIFLFYPLLDLMVTGSASRLLCAVDPMLSIFMVPFAAIAYCGIDVDDRAGKDTGVTTDPFPSKEGSDDDAQALRAVERLKRNLNAVMNCPQIANPLVSPILADEAIFKLFPYTCIFVSEYDPLLDDGVTLAKILRKVGRKHELSIFPVVHGFLSFCQNNSFCLQITESATRTMKDVIESFGNT